MKTPRLPDFFRRQGKSDTDSGRVPTMAHERVNDDVARICSQEIETASPLTSAAVNLKCSVQFAPDQTINFKYPVNCPVWYKPQSDESEPNVFDFFVGVIENVKMDVVSRQFIFEIRRQSGAHRIDTVLEPEIAYAAHCPVIIDLNGKRVEGEVICANPFCDGEEMMYSVMIQNGPKFRVQEVLASQVNFRRVLNNDNPNDWTPKKDSFDSTPKSDPKAPNSTAAVRGSMVRKNSIDSIPTDGPQSPWEDNRWTM
mmetsp:Transcript_31847/g.65877  ORF Transcript_31847/g.65877 Transcript_31847/m.65877 type:complete len:255 (+) Transcript_31847:60-824(+)